MRRRITTLLPLLLLSSCKSCDDPKPSTDAGQDSSPVTSASSEEASAPIATTVDAGPPVDAAPIVEEPFGDAGTSSCRLVYGPAEQPFRGPAAMLVANGSAPGQGQELRLIVNDAGKPRMYPIPITPVGKGAPSVVPPRPASFVGVRWPPCELAGSRFVYCQGPGGGITRTSLGAGDKNLVADSSKTVVSKSRAGTRIAAAALGAGGEHSVVAFLDVRHTTEGDMIQAFIAADEKEAVRLSDEGAGATTMRLFERGDKAVAVYLDTRTAMVPVHARPMSMRGADFVLGADVVVSVGGSPERGIDFTVANMSGATPSKGLALIPMPRDTMDFGMAAIAIEDPVKEDVATVWSKYPNGIDPAPIGATSTADGKGAWVVRTRPREKAVGSPRILEIGKVDPAGAFTSYGEMAPGRHVTDIALVADNTGGLWILYGDSTITWLERRICPIAGP